MRFLALVLVLSGFGASAFAGVLNELPLVNITTEAYPGQTYLMGFDLDENRQAVGLYYNDPYQAIDTNRLKQFSLADLMTTPQLLITRSGFEVVKLSYENNKLSILFKKDARKPDWSTKIYQISCDSANNNCNVIDGDTGKTTSNIFLASHHARILFIDTVVGIDSIESR